MLAMVAVGLWAGLNGGRALWAWPVAFVGVMLAGGALGIAGVPVPMVEPGILASVIVLGLLVLTAARLPVALGAALVAAVRPPARPRARRGAAGASRRRVLCRRLRARHRAAARHRPRRRLPVPAATAAVSSCAAPARWWPSPAWRSRSSEGGAHDPRRDHHRAPARSRSTPAARPITLTVANTGDRPIQVGSHYHFAETNPALQFDRAKARGHRLDIAAGTAVRFEPGQTREVQPRAFAGKREVYGFRQEVMGPLDADAAEGDPDA